MHPLRALLILLIGVVFVIIAPVGCIGERSNPAATQPVTITDIATTQPGFWYDKPAPATVVYDRFETFYKTCENVMRDYGFKIDRIDYRTGILTSEPLDSAQFFEPWRPDVQTLKDSRDSTMATFRRTIRFEFRRHEDGTFETSPKVLVERQTVQGRRITSVALFRGAYTAEDPRDAPHGTMESDEGLEIPPKFWFAVGRDGTLERVLAHEISARLARMRHDLPPSTMESSMPSTEPVQ